MFRRPREWAQIAQDPKTPYMIGRLLGANEMAVVLLMQEESERVKSVATALDKAVAYFMEERIET